MPEWTCLGNPASSFGEAAYGQPVTVGWWRPHRRPLLKEREKGCTPSCFTSTIQETRVTLPALIGPTRSRVYSEMTVGNREVFLDRTVRGKDCGELMIR